MAYIKRNWWRRNRPSLELYFSLWPLVRVMTRVWNESIEMAAFEYCRLEVWLFKRKLLSLRLYRRELENWSHEPPQKLSQRLRKAFSQLRHRKNANNHSR